MPQFIGLLTLFMALPVFATPHLDFRQTLERAIEKSPQYRTLKWSERNSELNEKNAWSQMLPTFDLQALHTYSQRGGNNLYSTPLTHEPWSNQLGFSVTENLYDNGDTLRAAEIATLTRRVQSLGLESGRSRLLVNVARAYYDFSAASAAVELQRQQIEALRTQFRAIEGRYQQGLRSNRDYLRIKSQLQSAEISLISQQLQLDQSRAELRLLIGETQEPEFIPFKPRDAQIEQIASVATALQPDSTYEYRIARLQDEIAEIRYQSVSRTEWPRLSLKGSYNYVQPQYLGSRREGVDDPYWNLQALVILDYRLFDWGRTSRTAEIADNQRQIEQESQRLSRLQVLQSIENLKKQDSLLHESFRMNQQILKTNEEAYQSLNRGYVDGKISYLELITALNDLYASRAQNMSLRFSILKLRAEMAHTQGNADALLLNP